ncbi:NADH dehydrogenase [ubiquinone] iron-sulfur protein 5-like [Watersipora subatra]|uniref:NADH dehydrogenase [ubiquinone] iron-sulfur protein 5-like n=1 Tax=Watersipora subatra TaxID=2589382 RepID=UPI00355AECA8
MDKMVYEKLPLKTGPHQTHRPFIYTPVTKMTEHWFTHSVGKCGKFEEAMFACGLQGSRDQMYKRCRREMEDLEECLFHAKQNARYMAIQKERAKQGKYEDPPLKGVIYHEPSPYVKIGSCK